MSRALWFAAGAGATLYASRKARRVKEAFTADGLRDRAGALALGARLARDEIAQGKVEKESELRERLGLAPLQATPQLEAGRHRAAAPTGPTGAALTTRTPVSTEAQEGSTH
jgi:hypothetical protein